MNTVRLSALCLTFTLAFLTPSASFGRSFYLNPYGAYVEGWTENHQEFCNQSPCQYVPYSAGDLYGSGTLTPQALGSASIPGAYAWSYLDVPGNQFLMKAWSDIPYPYDGDLYNSGAYTNGRMWDTVSFSGVTPGDVGNFIFSAPVTSNSTSSGGEIVIEAAGADPNSWVSVERDYLITGGTVGPITLTLTLPLDIGPIQFVELADLWSSTGVGAGIYSADVTLDPGWSFLLPSGVTVASASGAEYPVNAPAPDPSTIALFATGLAAAAAWRRKLSRQFVRRSNGAAIMTRLGHSVSE